jgi:hypothetical protein
MPQMRAVADAANVLRQPAWGRPKLILFVSSSGHDQTQIEGTYVREFPQQI